VLLECTVSIMNISPEALFIHICGIYLKVTGVKKDNLYMVCFFSKCWLHLKLKSIWIMLGVSWPLLHPHTTKMYF